MIVPPGYPLAPEFPEAPGVVPTENPIRPLEPSENKTESGVPKGGDMGNPGAGRVS